MSRLLHLRLLFLKLLVVLSRRVLQLLLRRVNLGLHLLQLLQQGSVLCLHCISLLLNRCLSCPTDCFNLVATVGSGFEGSTSFSTASFRSHGRLCIRVGRSGGAGGIGLNA